MPTKVNIHCHHKNKNRYDKDGNGIVDNAENIDAGEF